MRVVADENGWELKLEESTETADLAPSMPPVSATVATTAPGSGVFRKVDDDEATMPTDPPASEESDALEVRLPPPARLPPDLSGDKTRVA
jgi:hypothetical protein